MKGVIYRIFHRDNEDLCYIGSTTDYYMRKAHHKHSCNNVNNKDHNIKLYQIIRENGSWDCFQFDILEEVCCETKEELHKKEDEYITTLKPVMNSNKAFCAETKEEYHKQYYIDNKERIEGYQKQKNKCECGCEVSRTSIVRHRKSKKHLNLIQRTYSHSGSPSH